MTLRNTAISLLRVDGHDNIAKALRHNARHANRPTKLLLSSQNANLPRPCRSP
jgi:hypothetical protein